VAKAFDTVWVKGLYKLTVLNFPSYLAKTISYLDCRTFQASFQSATSTRRVMWAGVAQSGLVSPVLFSMYVDHIPTPSRHVEVAQYADDILSQPRPAIRLFSSVIWRPTSVYWSSGFGTRGPLSTSQKARLCSLPRPRDASDSPGQCSFREPIQWVQRARYLGVTLDTRLTWSARVNQVGKRGAQRLSVLGPS
jgi:hypothetical protein